MTDENPKVGVDLDKLEQRIQFLSVTLDKLMAALERQGVLASRMPERAEPRATRSQEPEAKRSLGSGTCSRCAKVVGYTVRRKLDNTLRLAHHNMPNGRPCSPGPHEILNCGHTKTEHKEGVLYTSGIPDQGPTKPVELSRCCYQVDEDLIRRTVNNINQYAHHEPTPLQVEHIDDLEALKNVMLQRDIGYDDIKILVDELESIEICICNSKDYCDEGCLPCRGRESCQA